VPETRWGLDLNDERDMGISHVGAPEAVTIGKRRATAGWQPHPLAAVGACSRGPPQLRTDKMAAMGPPHRRPRVSGSQDGFKRRSEGEGEGEARV
jgi:hypothetical protein